MIDTFCSVAIGKWLWPLSNTQKLCSPFLRPIVKAYMVMPWTHNSLCKWILLWDTCSYLIVKINGASIKKESNNMSQNGLKKFKGRVFSSRHIWQLGSLDFRAQQLLAVAGPKPVRYVKNVRERYLKRDRVLFSWTAEVSGICYAITAQQRRRSVPLPYNRETSHDTQSW